MDIRTSKPGDRITGEWGPGRVQSHTDRSLVYVLDTGETMGVVVGTPGYYRLAPLSRPGRYTVLRTITDDHQDITDQPAAGRIIAQGDDYLAMLRVARENRTNTWRKGDEIRVLTERQTAGCAWTDEALFQWLHNAELLKLGGYAIVTETENLGLYETA